MRQHPPCDAEQPRDGVPVSVTAAAAEPRRRTKRAEERLAHCVRDVTGVGASRDGVAKHPLLVTAIETAERLGVTPGRGLQQVRVGLVHACYLPVSGRAFHVLDPVGGWSPGEPPWTEPGGGEKDDEDWYNKEIAKQDGYVLLSNA
jgi:hypothetical protein